MDKYYTPSIEEFHIGFEYEQLCNNHNWTKMIKPREDNWEWVKKEFNTSTSLSKIAQEIKGVTVRVKHLDEQDILELGWQKKAKKLDIGVEGYVKTIDLFGFNNSRTHLLYNINNVWKMLIQDNNSYGTPSVEIKLNIKNKSELQRLMQQMGISVVDYYTYPGCNIEIGLNPKPYVHDSSMI